MQICFVQLQTKTKLRLNQQSNVRQENQLKSHERAKVYPEIECTSKKASEQMNFEITQLKLIRYDRTFFICRMTPSYHTQSTVFMLHGYALKYPFNIVRLLVFPETILMTSTV